MIDNVVSAALLGLLLAGAASVLASIAILVMWAVRGGEGGN